MLIYCVRCLVNDRCYIGKTSRTLQFRWRQHKTEARIGRYDWPLYRDMRKYGVERFEITVLAEARSESQINRLEKKLMDEYRVCETGYNQTQKVCGGKDKKPERASRGVPLPREHRQRIAESVRKAWQQKQGKQEDEVPF